MKILNLYAGIGGNRKHWDEVTDVDVTAVELDKDKAKIYQDFFPEDEVIVGDAHKYLLKNFEDYDFIWSSPPCPSHSRIRNIAGVGRGQNAPIYPDMKLYEEIIFLKNVFKSSGTNFNGKYVVENVVSYYEPLIEPQKRSNHYFWSNFKIPEINIKSNKHSGTIKELEELKGFNLSEYKGINKNKILRNCVNPEVGKHILKASITKTTLF